VFVWRSPAVGTNDSAGSHCVILQTNEAKQKEGNVLFANTGSCISKLIYRFQNLLLQTVNKGEGTALLCHVLVGGFGCFITF
jgi:hypothetical protein